MYIRMCMCMYVYVSDNKIFKIMKMNKIFKRMNERNKVLHLSIFPWVCYF